jgi:SNF2 family DNA or RNA helicase
MLSVTFEKFIERAKIDYKEHQKVGVDWCMNNENREDAIEGIRGGFIADEMGLGKTIMSLGLIVCNFGKYRRTLIVLPNVLMDQWKDEILRSCGHFVLVYHGIKKKKITREMLEKAPIVLTTYSMISISKKKLLMEEKGLIQNSGCVLHEVLWDRIVFDEAHHLRNRNARYWGIRKLNSTSKWFISGTPIQNCSKDFTNLCSLLGFKRSFVVDKENRDVLFRDFVLRRTKEDVGIPFPQLTMEKKEISWNDPNEKRVAQFYHNQLYNASEKLPYYTYARKVCILPRMLKQHASGEKEDSTAWCSVFQTLCDIYETESSKMNVLFEKLRGNHGNGNGKLIFCHYHEEIDYIIRKLRDMGYERIASFDGRIKVKDRPTILKNDLEVLILQIQTGCEGLNLQKYSEVYFISPHWNPAIEEQAVARCHRIGQTKPVQVYKYCMESLEDLDVDGKIVPVDTLEKTAHDKQINKKIISHQDFYSCIQHVN